MRIQTFGGAVTVMSRYEIGGRVKWPGHDGAGSPLRWQETMMAQHVLRGTSADILQQYGVHPSDLDRSPLTWLPSHLFDTEMEKILTDRKECCGG